MSVLVVVGNVLVVVLVGVLIAMEHVPHVIALVKDFVSISVLIKNQKKGALKMDEAKPVIFQDITISDEDFLKEINTHINKIIGEIAGKKSISFNNYDRFFIIEDGIRPYLPHRIKITVEPMSLSEIREYMSQYIEKYEKSKCGQEFVKKFTEKVYADLYQYLKNGYYASGDSTKDSENMIKKVRYFIEDFNFKA